MQSTSLVAENLVTINTANGAATVVGSASFPIGGLAYDSQRDQLLGMDGGVGDLYEVNRNSGATTLLHAGPPANGANSLTYDSELDLFWDLGYDGNLSSYDPNSSYARTVHLTGLQPVAGLAFKISSP